jgi:predicted Zn finger-like uncharacterized protein
MGAEIGDLDTEVVYASDSTFMILTCPDCATRYSVPDEQLGPAGRTVRCAACGTRWTARAEEPLELSPDPVLDADGPEDSAPAPTLAADELPKIFRDRAQAKLKERQAAANGVVWAGLAGVFALMLGVTVVMRQNVAQIFPRAAGAYAMAGLPVNLVGLTIEGQHAQPTLKDGHAALTVTGALRNIRDKAIIAPPLKISLLNPAGRAVAVKIEDPAGASIPPGEARHFVVDLLDPPISATDVEIAFVLDGPRRKAVPKPAIPAPTRLSLRGATDPAPPPPAQGPLVPAINAQDARPLPSSSPYALPAPR